MKKQAYLWATELLAQFIEGASDSFLIIAGGSTVVHATANAVAMPSITAQQLVISVLLGGLLYAASYLKKTPLPSRMTGSLDAQDRGVVTVHGKMQAPEEWPDPPAALPASPITPSAQ